MSFDNLKLRTKTLIPLMGMAILFAGVITVGALKLNDLTQRYGEIIGQVDPAILRVNRAMRITSDLGREVYAILVYDPADPRAKAVITQYGAAKAGGDKALAEAAKLDPVRADRYIEFRQRFDAIYDQTEAPTTIAESVPGLAAGSKLTPAQLDQMAKAAVQLEQLDSDISDFSKKLQTSNHALEAENDATVEQLKRQAEQAIWMMVGLGAVSIVGGLGISMWIANGKVAAPLARLSERMKRLAEGDLAVDIEGQNRLDEVGAMAKAVQVFKDNALKSRAMEAEAQALRDATETQRQAAERERAARAAELAQVVDTLAGGLQTLAEGVLTHRLNTAFAGEFEPLRNDYNAAMAKVQTALGAVVSSAHGINAGAGEITQAADDLSRRTEQQAASLEETAAALDQITATVRRTAEGAKHASNVVHKAQQDAQESGGIVDGAIKAMDAIERSSGEISQIIGVIDEIAFQTNLLALNAGVEAARAGDAGRGFAVVAQEVRALAQRSADAAKEIKALISTSAQEVGNGVDLVGQAGRSLQRIASQVAEINTIVEEITRSTQEQAVGLAQVNTAVNQMDQMTQQNAAMVEQSTAASHSLAREADTLAKLTRGFKVGEEAADGARQTANPVHKARTRIASFANAGATALATQSWEEF